MEVVTDMQHSSQHHQITGIALLDKPRRAAYKALVQRASMGDRIELLTFALAKTGP